MDYVTVEEAIALPGLRLAITQGSPGPWGMSARTFFEIKGVPFRAVAQIAGDANEALKAWTGQSSAPVAMFEEERARANWSEILLLAERLDPEPRLIPVDEDARTAMFGLCHEICAEDGLGWSLRVLLYGAIEAAGNAPAEILRAKYLAGTEATHARLRVNAVIGLLARRLTAQEAAGSGYFVGDRLSAADVYWTAFSNLLDAMPEDFCTRPDYYRTVPEICAAFLDAPLPAVLIAHRNRMLHNHFKLPMWF